MKRRRFLQLTAAAAMLPAAARIASAQSYPSRPITLIVPYPPGGLSDISARLVVDGMAQALGQSIIIENVGGASGSIGTGRVARAEADGYTIALGIWNTHVANGVSLRLTYDIVNDFMPIMLIADAPLLLLARKDLPANSFKEMVAWLKANPDKATMGSTGVGGPGHMLALLLQKETGTRFSIIPYKGVTPALQDVVAGQIDLTIGNTASSMPHVRAGKMKAFAVSSGQRISIAPDIVSADEAGFPWFTFSLWAGLFAPKGTPKDIVAKLNAAALSSVNNPATRKKYLDQGFVIPPRERQTPEALAAYQKAEIKKWWPIIEGAGLKAKDS